MANLQPQRKLAVALVCDFVYPRLGGVEMHIWCLAQCLLKMGHKVIVVTNMYNTANGKRVGIRYMTNGLKLYYMPVIALVDQATMPSYYAYLPLFRRILIRERIDIVHGHSATSPLMHECILQAKAMGYKVGARRGQQRGAALPGGGHHLSFEQAVCRAILLSPLFKRGGRGGRSRRSNLLGCYIYCCRARISFVLASLSHGVLPPALRSASSRITRSLALRMPRASTSTSI